MKSLLIATILVLMSVSTGFANTVYSKSGEVIDKHADINLWPVQFKTKAEAEAVAKTLENGQVFRDADTHLYQVFYGNAVITGIVVIGSINEQ